MSVSRGEFVRLSSSLILTGVRRLCGHRAEKLRSGTSRRDRRRFRTSNNPLLCDSGCLRLQPR